MHDNEIARFRAEVLKQKTCPNDLLQLLQLQLARVENDEEYADPLEAMACRLLEPGATPCLLDFSYLNDNDRTNPDTMANVAATDRVFAYITFVAENNNGDVLGYWHGPENTPIEAAPIVKYDTEGQFYLLSGANLAEALLDDYVAFDDAAQFNELRDWFAACGIQIRPTCWDELQHPTPSTEPDDLHHKFYNEERIKAGLEPIEP